MKTIEKIYQYYTRDYSISTDSRKITKDCVFVALKGERFDGNDFAYQVAEDNIAACVIADRKDLPEHERLFIVEDSLSTLQELARYHRDKFNIPIIGITGTNGKTTTKELVASVLAKTHKIIYTQGNFNNHLGVPLTLLQIKPETELAVVEMGANHPNEIKQLCEITKPNYGIITNIGKAHIEGFGSYEGIIKTKNELYNYISNTGGKVFVNHDNALLMDLSKEIDSMTYGTVSDADINAHIISSNPYLTIMWNGKEIKTQLVGEYNFENVLAAICTGQYFNIDKSLIIDALEKYVPTNNRSQFIKSNKNEIVMDAYNANPTSMSASIKNFRNISDDKSLLILGDMRELGEESENEHLTILKTINKLKFRNVILVGSEFKNALNTILTTISDQIQDNINFKSFDNVDDLINHIINNDNITGMKILVKGSHSIHLEKLVNIL